jgi:hypothetical protein
MIQKTSQLIIRAACIYISAFAAWLLYVIFYDLVIATKIEPIDQEALAILICAIIPLSTILNLILIYTLSILDKLILKPKYVISSTFVVELVTILSWNKFSEDLIFLAHVAAMILFFVVWHINHHRKSLRNALEKT